MSISKIISDTEAQRLKSLFTEPLKGYDFDVNSLFDFKTILQNAPDDGKSKGLAIRFGRSRTIGNLNIAMEVVLFERDLGTGDLLICGFLADEDFVGRLSTDFSRSYTTPHDRAEMNDAIQILDDSGVKLALIGFDTLAEFLGQKHEFTKLRIGFARNDLDQLTVILSRQNSLGNVRSTALGINGTFLDDHDLVPPPDIV